MLKKGITYFVLGAVVMVCIWLYFLKGTVSQGGHRTVIKTDTIYINKPYEKIVLRETVKPHKIYIHKTDTLIREKLIYDTLFLAIELDQTTAKIHLITPEGIPIIKQHQLPEFESLKLDYEGNLEIKPKRKSKKKLWRNLERIGIAIGGFYLGSKL